jgi:hypothetical protein
LNENYGVKQKFNFFFIIFLLHCGLAYADILTFKPLAPFFETWEHLPNLSSPLSLLEENNRVDVYYQRQNLLNQQREHDKKRNKIRTDSQSISALYHPPIPWIKDSIIAHAQDMDTLQFVYPENLENTYQLDSTIKNTVNSQRTVISLDINHFFKFGLGYQKNDLFEAPFFALSIQPSASLQLTYQEFTNAWALPNNTSFIAEESTDTVNSIINIFTQLNIFSSNEPKQTTLESHQAELPLKSQNKSQEIALLWKKGTIFQQKMTIQPDQQAFFMAVSPASRLRLDYQFKQSQQKIESNPILDGKTIGTLNLSFAFKQQHLQLKYFHQNASHYWYTKYQQSHLTTHWNGQVQLLDSIQSLVGGKYKINLQAKINTQQLQIGRIHSFSPTWTLLNEFQFIQLKPELEFSQKKLSLLESLLSSTEEQTNPITITEAGLLGLSFGLKYSSKHFSITYQWHQLIPLYLKEQLTAESQPTDNTAEPTDITSTDIFTELQKDQGGNLQQIQFSYYF